MALLNAKGRIVSITSAKEIKGKKGTFWARELYLVNGADGPPQRVREMANSQKEFSGHSAGDEVELPVYVKVTVAERTGRIFKDLIVIREG